MIIGISGGTGSGKTTVANRILESVSADEVAHLPGVSMVTSHNHAYHFNVSGSMDALIKALSRHEVLRLQAEEAPLEEVFLQFYENPQAETAAPGTR